MASIQERTDATGKIHFRVQIRLRGFPPEQATFERKTDARKWAAQTETAIREGRYFKTVEGRRHTFGEMIDRYIENVLPRKKQTSRHSQAPRLIWWKERLGHYLLADVTPPMIAERRAVPLVGYALACMKERSRIRRLDNSHVFPAPRKTGEPINIKTSWTNAIKAAGIENFHFHDLRHSAASYLAMNGATTAELAEILGHKTLAMVKRYSHLSTSHTSGVLERMAAKIFAEPTKQEGSTKA